LSGKKEKPAQQQNKNPYQTGDAWSVFNKRKKELKSKHLGSVDPNLKLNQGQQRSVSQ